MAVTESHVLSAYRVVIGFALEISIDVDGLTCPGILVMDILFKLLLVVKNHSKSFYYLQILLRFTDIDDYFLLPLVL